MKDAATASYGKKGENIVKMNHDAIDRGMKDVKKFEVPASWKSAGEDKPETAATGDRKDLVGFRQRYSEAGQRAEGHEASLYPPS